MRKELNRREFLEIGFAAAAGLTLFTETASADEVPSKKLREEMMTYRRRLRLRREPKEFETYSPLQATIDWYSTPAYFRSELLSLQSYIGPAAEGFLKAAYPKNITKLVRGIAEDTGIFFINAIDRRLILLPSYYQPNILEVALLTYHEGAGHGVDPEMFSGYPPEKFFELEAAKWQMLSQADSIPGQFLNSPDDTIHRQVFANVGRLAGQAYVLDRNFAVSPSAGVIKDAVGKVAKLLGVNTTKPVFTKRFCYDLGQLLYPEIKNGRVFSFQDAFEDVFSIVLGEIYAEMIKWSLIPVDLIPAGNETVRNSAVQTQNNPVIRQAVERTIKSVSEEPANMDIIHERIRRIYFEVQPVPVAVSIHNPESLREQPVMATIKQTASLGPDWFVINQMTRGLDPETKATLEEYFLLRYKLLSNYSGAAARNVDPEEDIKAFDPPFLHAWESDEVARAVSADLLVEYLRAKADGSDISGYIDDFRNYNEILKTYRETPLFK